VRPGPARLSQAAGESWGAVIECVLGASWRDKVRCSLGEKRAAPGGICRVLRRGDVALLTICGFEFVWF